MQLKKGIRIFKFVFSALVNPLIFLLFVWLFMFLFGPQKGSFGPESSWFIESIKRNEYSTLYRIKFLPYFAFAVSVSYLVLLAQYTVLKKYKTFEDMVDKKLSIFYLIVCGVGGFNAYLWLYRGIDAVASWLVIPHLVGLSIIILIYEIVFLFRFRKDKP